ncbi:radical SAM peptide maturase [Draconibacterium sp. IB214405]|uniref:radical SAM peptide maturase n=1 Tax=Draconibacterium sp. IB214405 TaxID=3097352 RepID=UPI002A0EE7EE|nr:radical SAM peptide maturase [Draconibacterium sp. IB214405]MDX8341765.1 radical SAM peptide maturase [Draconibacterium sp. IB214405]
MDSLYLIKTNNNNHYFVNLLQKRIIYCHPIVLQIFRLWVKNSSNFNLDFIAEQLSNFDGNQLKYYFKKTREFIEEGFLVNTSIKRLGREEMLPEQIKGWLVNSRQVTFEVTETCNLNCKYCGFGELYSEEDSRTKAKMDSRVAIRFLEYMRSYWNSSNNRSHNKYIVIGFYGGEPLLNIEFIRTVTDFVDKSDFKHNRIVYNMTTNGVLLDKYIDFLVEQNFMLTISLDGNEIHNSYRVQKDSGESFNKVFKNVEFIQKKYPDFFKENVSFNSVLHDRNNIEDILLFFEKKFDKVPSINQLTEAGIKEDKKDLFLKMFKSSFLSLNESRDLDYLKNKMKITYPGNQDRTFLLNTLLENTFHTFNDLLIDEKVNVIEKFPTGTCYPFTRKIFVSATGKILPCESISHKFSLGEVTSKDVELNFNSVSDRYKKYYSSIKNQCQSCYNFHMCKECFYKIEGIGEIAICDRFMDLANFKKYLTNSLTYFEDNPLLYENLMEENILL